MILAGRQLVRRAAESHRRFASDPWQAPWLPLPRLKKYETRLGSNEDGDDFNYYPPVI